MNAYGEWLKREEGWMEEIEKKNRALMWKYSILIIIGCPVAVVLIGIVSGGSVQMALGNAVYGLIFGVVVAAIFLLCMLASKPGKKYKKALKRAVEDKLGAGEREEFAAQMLDPATECFSWVNKEKEEQKVWVAKDYVLKSSSRGWASLVDLGKVEKMELDSQDYNIKTGGGGVRVSTSVTYFYLEFTYKQDGNKKKGNDPDVKLAFESPETRAAVAECVRRNLEARAR